MCFNKLTHYLESIILNLFIQFVMFSKNYRRNINNNNITSAAALPGWQINGNYNKPSKKLNYYDLWAYIKNTDYMFFAIFEGT